MPSRRQIMIAFGLGCALALSASVAWYGLSRQSDLRPLADHAFRPPAHESVRPATAEVRADARQRPRMMMGWSAEVARCAAGVRIGIVTGRFDQSHPVLAKARAVWRDFWPAGAKSAAASRGTSLLALLAGQSEAGATGLIPEAQFLLADALFADRNGAPGTDVVTILKSLNWLGEHSAQVVLLDLAGPRDELVQQAISGLAGQGTIVVMPASDRLDAHAYADAIVVGAIGADRQPYQPSPGIMRIDLYAPGLDIWTALPERSQGLVSGSSFAAAHAVAAVAAVYPLLAAHTPAEQRIAHVVRYLPVRDAGEGRKLVTAPVACIAVLGTAPTAPHSKWTSIVEPK